MSTHEIDFAKVNSGVVVYPRIGFNPYIAYKNLFEFIEELAEKGKLSHGYQLIKDSEARKSFDSKITPGAGKRAIFQVRGNFDDFMMANFLSDDDFQDFVDKHNLFVAGRRFNPDKLVTEVYIKSRSGKDYRKMLNDSLYHPPHVLINEDKAKKGELYLDHVFEGRTLVTRYIPAVLRGLSYLFGGMVKLETTEFELDNSEESWLWRQDPEYRPKYKRHRVIYSCLGQKIGKTLISTDEGAR
ncbi:MAG: SpoVR family protein, partial [Candidatus Yanofskybacteria bacterium]|nr:SpoVR family protein [Candidatus Yanofskybacteria bacterium]